MAKKKVKPVVPVTPIVKAGHGRKIDPLVALLVLDENGPCTQSAMMELIKQDLRLTSDEEFDQASNYSFVPTVITPLLDNGWVIRKYENAEYIFSITPAGKAEIERQF